MDQMMIGAIAMGFGAAALFFIHYWRATHDRLFALFALSFIVLAANRVAQGLLFEDEVGGHYIYWIRFVAFLLILLAIIDKNLSRRRAGR